MYALMTRFTDANLGRRGKERRKKERKRFKMF
jgi:hypothetical protein